MNFEFRYSNGRSKRFADLQSFCAALGRKRAAEATVWAYTRHGSSVAYPVDTPEQAREAVAQIEQTLADIRLKERRPHLWAELRPDAMRTHMARRPAGYPRADWAEQIADASLDDCATVDEQCLAVPRDVMDAHMAKRPSGHPRPDWRRRIVAEPPGGYDAYARLVLGASVAPG